jgi:hypothetical protein
LLISNRQIPRNIFDRREMLKSACLIAVGGELAAGMLRFDRGIAVLLLTKLDEPRVIAIRERIEQERVDDAKNRGVHSNRGRKRDHSQGGESGRLEKLSQSETKIVHGNFRFAEFIRREGR